MKIFCFRFALKLATTLLLGAALCAHAADARKAAGGEKRVALVIGNSDYPTSALGNPKNDASAIAKSLSRLGFDVELKTNASKADMDAAMRRLGNRADKADVAVLFYAGHGIQVNGFNYLVPLDAKPQNERDLKREMVKLDDIIDDMGSAKVKLVFFDACRDNPLARSFTRGASRGLAAPAEASGTLISFATKHGNTASDGEGRHSPYTLALLDALENPDGEIEKLLRRVQQSVKKATNGQQEPWKYGSLDGDFYFRLAAAAPSSAVIPASAMPQVADAAVELSFWNGALQANNEEAYQDYLKNYPSGRFAVLARASLSKLQRGTRPASGQPDPLALEQEYWNRIRNSRDAEDFSAYLADHPNGVYAPQARLALSQIKREHERQAPAQAPKPETARMTTNASTLPTAAVAAKPAALPPAPSPYLGQFNSPNYTVSLPEQAQKSSSPLLPPGSQASPASERTLASGKPRIGDSFTYQTFDLLTKSKKTFDPEVVVAVTDQSIIYNDGRVATDLNGNYLRYPAGFPFDFQLDGVLPLLTTDYSVGKTWSTHLSFTRIGVAGLLDLNFKIVAKERISLPAGEFDAFKIEAEGATSSGMRHSYQIWASPDLPRPLAVEFICKTGWRHVCNDRVELVAFKRSN